jgi:hypothetical protein
MNRCIFEFFQEMIQKQVSLLKLVLKSVFELPDAALRLQIIRKMMDSVPYNEFFMMDDDVEPSYANRTAGQTMMKELKSFVDKKMEEFNNGTLSMDGFGEEVEGEAESIFKELFLGEDFVMPATEARKQFEVLIYVMFYHPSFE